MVQFHEIEGLRRSHAMAPLAPGQVSDLLAMCADLVAERAEIVAILADLHEPFAGVRSALNRLSGLTGSQ